ncbi:MAG: hypothetical protein FWE04_06325 [Oscillospiraceae bacterium]|nr:hypothetical protein [Oscillospiraceae bacterium]
MKKLTCLFAALIIVITLTACGNTNESESTDLPYENEEPRNNDDAQETTYTIEQIQIALEPQFRIGSWGEELPQVISVERVERDRDGWRPEGAGPGPYTVDLTNSVRYRVTVRFIPYPEDYDSWDYSIAFWAESGEYRVRRDCDFILLDEYYYFNDVNGEPELAFLSC